MEKTFKLNRKGNIELSKEEFEKCLDDNFWLGYAHGVANTYDRPVSCYNCSTNIPDSYIYSTPNHVPDYALFMKTCCTQRRGVI